MARVLMVLLQRRFGPLPELRRLQVTKATDGQLEQWAVRVTDAHSLEDVFAG